jgi:hypothetical protein
MFEKPPRYRSYLLTLWEERNRDPNLPVVWRFSLEEARSGQRRGFADLEALVVALKQEMADDQAEAKGPGARLVDETSRPPSHSSGETSLGRRRERR